jgi:hypothetical protein
MQEPILRKPIEIPEQLDGLFASTCGGLGDTPDAVATIYWGFDAILQCSPPLTILDWEISQMNAGTLTNFLPQIFKRLDELRSERKSVLFGEEMRLLIEPQGIGEVLFERGFNAGLPVQMVDEEVVTLKDYAQRALTASAYITSGAVQLSRPAFEKRVNFKGISRNHLTHQLGAFAVGQKSEEAGVLLIALADAILDAFLNDRLRARAGAA